MVWSTVWSNLGQTWSTLVKLGQNSPSPGKCIPDHLSRVSRYGAPCSGLEGLGQILVNTWSTSVKLGQSSRNSGKCVPDHVLRLFGAINLRRIGPTWFRLPRFTCRHPRKSRGKKWGYDKSYEGRKLAKNTFDASMVIPSKKSPPMPHPLGAKVVKTEHHQGVRIAT